MKKRLRKIVICFYIIFSLVFSLTNPITAMATGSVSGGDVVNDIIRSAVVEGEFTTTGTWGTSTGCKNYDGGNTLWSNTAGSTLTFNIGEIAAGKYQVYYWTTANKTCEMPLVVTHKGESSTVTVPVVPDGATAAWYCLGELDFAGDGSETISYTFTAGSATARGTAVKLVPVEEEEEEEEVVEIIKSAIVEGEFTTTGTWGTSTGCKNYDGGNTLWSNTAGSTLTFNIGGIAAGKYQVYYWTTANKTCEMPLVVTHKGESSTVTVPVVPDGATAAWYCLGELDFAGDGSETIGYTFTAGSATARGTAVKLVPVEEEEEEEEVVEIIKSAIVEGEFTTTGTWGTSTGCKNYDGGNTLWSNTAGSTLTFNIGGIAAGKYQVYYWTTANKTCEMPLVVTHKGESSTVTVPVVPDGATAAWYCLGELDFAGDGSETISYTFTAGSATARGTAVKLVPVEEEEEVVEIIKSAIVEGEFTTTGTWGTSTGCKNYDGGNTLWSNTAGSTLTFNIGEIAAGNYQVYYWTTANKTCEMPLVVTHKGESSTVTVPVVPDGATAAWYCLGELDFAGDGSETISYTFTAGSATARGTAVKLVPVEEEEEEEEVVEIIKSAIVEGEFTTTGTWGTSTGYKNYDGGNTLWSNTAGSTLTFNIGEIEAGNYELYYWVAYNSGNLKEMPFVVTHKSGPTTIKVPTLETGNEGSWYYMGVLDFEGNGTETVKFDYPVNENRSARGTAIKLVSTNADVDKSKAEGEDSSEHAIDVEPYPGFSFVGNWNTSAGLTGPMTKYPYSMWINKDRIDSSPEPYNLPENNYCKYRPDLQATAGVKVSAYLLYWDVNQANDTVYEVHHNGTVDTIHIDLTQITKSGWYELGTFDFSGPYETNFVKIVCTDADNYGGSTNFRASTIRFDVLNDATSGGIWQTVYVSPSPEAEVPIIAELNQFEDIAEDAENKYDIEYMFNEGFVTGTAEHTFSPNEVITKVIFVNWLSNVLEITDEDIVEPLLSGIDNNEVLTKEEIAQILHNAVRYLNKNVQWLHSLTLDYKELPGADSVSEWAEDAMDSMYRCGIVTVTEGNLAPQKEMTRGEAAVMLKGFVQQFVQAGPNNDDGEEWVLTLNEEFQGTELDSNVWTAADENPGHILSSRHPENVEVHDGALHLVTKYESRVEGKNWTTGNIAVNEDTFLQEYGYWEARYKYTKANGINNAFWMMTLGESGMDWYEIDINEGHYANRVNTNLHEYASTNLAKKTEHSERYMALYDLSEDYHTYAVEWTPEELKYYFDGELIHTKDNPTEGGRLSVPRLSTAVLSWAGSITQGADGTEQVVDYVRIYQRNSDIAEHTQATEHALDGLSACDLKKVEATAANCTKYGINEHWKCTICNKLFADENGTTEIDITATINSSQPPVTDAHVEEIIPAKEATCTETGLTEGKKCSVCGETLVVQTEIEVKAHTESVIGKYDATCVTAGYTGDKICSVCRKTLESGSVTESTGVHTYLDGVCTMCQAADPDYQPTKEVELGTTGTATEALRSVAQAIINSIDEDGKLSVNIKVSDETRKNIEEFIKEAENSAVINIILEKVASLKEESEVSSETIAAFEAKLEEIANSVTNNGKFGILQHLDLSILIKAHNVTENKKITLGELEESPEEIEFTITVPERYLESEYQLFVLRYHNGQVDKLALSNLQENKFALLTDKFSDYALGYVKTEKQENVNDDETIYKEPEVSAPASEESVVISSANPNTGDSTNGLWIVVLLASVMGLIVLFMKKRSFMH